MRTYFLALSFLAVVGCSNSNQDKKQDLSSQSSEVYDIPTIDVVNLLNNSDEYVGKEVIVTGTVVHVCKHSGKRLHLMGNDEKTKIRLESGEIGQFDRNLEGSDILAKGIFRKEVIDEAYMAKWSEEMQKEGTGEHKSHEEQEEEKGKMQMYKEMMVEAPGGHLENIWIDGISFESTNL